MHQHTPGPWAAMQHYTDDKRDGTLIVGPDKWHIASCWATRFSDGRSITETDANATLIAAAPDILAALVQLVDWATHPDTTDWLNRSGVLGNYGKAVVDARYAIAKAQGELEVGEKYQPVNAKPPEKE